ncbi:META domain-containing protein [Algoriphagus halophytocola]|uniref:META domain-containing protein n=1 Tax=Algoriphagus halophytocola TaxID=2991499 RepID=A0ABY6MEE5_9BACT|nr:MULTISPECIES: META domain-containing protein [unclassified Algoriphagus]UZD20986.1 META domain-containing protein [Algoriphagus sp. TR-M5]WBL42152.1 META domain-containing protein [Algoriphagus sp. TR-M9]
MKLQQSIIAVIFIIVLVSCGSTKAINPLNLLTGNDWALASLNGNSLDLSQFAGGIPSLSFLEEGRLAGFTGCNNFSGNFSLEGSGLKLDPGAITKKMCPGTGEQDFISALNKVKDLKIDQDKLTLIDGGQELMSFVPKKE